MDLDIYKKRLKKANQSDALLYNSIKQVNNSFDNSPNFYNITINGLDYDVHINSLKGEKKELLLRPDTTLQKGSIADIHGENWIVTEFKPNKIYPKAVIDFCNQSLKWKRDDVTFEYPCFVSKSKNYRFKETNTYMDMSEADIEVYTQYNSDTDYIHESQRFLFNGKSFEVVGVDNFSQVYKDDGILIISLQRASSSELDDGSTNTAGDGNSSGWEGGW